jgi:hypothetical protein
MEPMVHRKCFKNLEPNAAVIKSHTCTKQQQQQQASAYNLYATTASEFIKIIIF